MCWREEPGNFNGVCGT
ncbi:hypothetical protein CFP56_027404 [Quercus suber]|uniref:Uncharacterized protein n=1 Tax=Quercus suber TaxID=58331 RepID=A0AAW0JZ00_QUESU